MDFDLGPQVLLIKFGLIKHCCDSAALPALHKKNGQSVPLA